MSKKYTTLLRHRHDLRFMESCLTEPIDWFNQFGEVVDTPQGVYIFQDNGADVLAVAHLDSVSRACKFEIGTTWHKGNKDAPAIRSPWLDDRIGAYIILGMLPKLGVKVDVLLTEGEESGRSTAKFFNQAPFIQHERPYNWLVEFDRRGGDVVMYDYHTEEMEKLLEMFGFSVGWGSFTDICSLTHLGRWGMNIGVGYANYHAEGAYCVVEELEDNLDRFLAFYRAHKHTEFLFDPAKTKRRQFVYSGWKGNTWTGGYDDYDDEWRYRDAYLGIVTARALGAGAQKEVKWCTACGIRLDDEEAANGEKCLDCLTTDYGTYCETCDSQVHEQPFEGAVACGCGRYRVFKPYSDLEGSWVDELENNWTYYPMGYSLGQYLQLFAEGILPTPCARCGDKLPSSQKDDVLCETCSIMLKNLGMLSAWEEQVGSALQCGCLWREWATIIHHERGEIFGKTYADLVHLYSLEDCMLISVLEILSTQSGFPALKEAWEWTADENRSQTGL